MELKIIGEVELRTGNKRFYLKDKVDFKSNCYIDGGKRKEWNPVYWKVVIILWGLFIKTMKLFKNNTNGWMF